MDVSKNSVILHPLAKDMLFKHYNPLRKIFSNILGQLETDYVAIALVDSTDQLLLFSSSPSTERNIIEQELWHLDKCYQAETIFQDEPVLWHDLYDFNQSHLLYQYRLTKLGLKSGISIPIDFKQYRAIFSFGFKHDNPCLKSLQSQYCSQLIALGKFCLKKILASLPLPDKTTKVFKLKPKFELLINNEAVYNNATR